MIFGEDEPEPQQPSPHSQQRIRLDTSGLETVYANSFALASTAEEITVYLGVNSPMPGVKQPLVKVSHRLVLNPPNAKRLMLALQQTVRAHEDRFGPIELPPPPKPGGPR
jgi:hypothetical protein